MLPGILGERRCPLVLATLARVVPFASRVTGSDSATGGGGDVMRMSSFALCALVVGAGSVAAAEPCLYRTHRFSEGAVSCQVKTLEAPLDIGLFHGAPR